MSWGPENNRGRVWALLLVIVAGAAIGAVLAIELVVKRLQAQLIVQDEQLRAYIDQPLNARATVLNELKIAIDEVVSTRVPVDTVLSVPVEEPLELLAEFDALVPVRVNVPINDVIMLEQEIDIDTMVEADLLGETFELPLRGRFPVKAAVPVRVVVPIDQEVHLRFTAPIDARLKQNLVVPLKTEIVAEVPLKTQMSVPVLNDLDVLVEIPKEPHLDVNLNYADLIIPLADLEFGLVDEAEGAAPMPPAAETKP